MMGWFGAASPFDSDVEKATSENNTSEQWGLILDICDKASSNSEDAKNCLRSVCKRLNHTDPHVAIQAATLLDACVSNCGKVFHIEVASRDFETEYCKLIKKAHPKVVQKLKESLKKWADGEFKTDRQLNLIPSLYLKLKNSGIDFSAEMPTKKTVTLSKDPNVVQSQEEEDQIAKAIELSLKETSNSPRNTSTSASLYPTNIGSALNNATPANSTPVKELRKVRALYDFEAAEDNELTFTAGEIIVVLDDTDCNWWKGSNQRGEGLFPANFVTADLSVEPETVLIEKAKKLVQFKDNVEVVEDKIPDVVEIDEKKLDNLLHMLHEADPTSTEDDSDELLKLEREVNGMGPLIDAELERVDRKHAQLTKLSSDLVEALSLYHTLMREPQYTSMNKLPYNYQNNIPTSVPMMYNGGLSQPPPGMPPQFMGPYSLPPGSASQQDRQFLPHQMPQQLPPPNHMPIPQVALQQQPPPNQGPPLLPHQMLPPGMQQGSRVNIPNMTSLPNQPGMQVYSPQMIPSSYPMNVPIPSTQLGNPGSGAPNSHFQHTTSNTQM